jgi:hypothetical protein
MSHYCRRQAALATQHAMEHATRWTSSMRVDHRGANEVEISQQERSYVGGKFNNACTSINL